MMASKAKLFKDYDTMAQIIITTEPKQQKALGRKIKNFDQNEWDKNKEQIIFDANYAKFTQNTKLKQRLLSFENRTFVEASKSDKIYGIGIGVRDEKANNPRNWRGQNLLGMVITKIRDSLLIQQQQEQTENKSNDYYHHQSPHQEQTKKYNKNSSNEQMQSGQRQNKNKKKKMQKNELY